jgi:very-short-patch-repair endonuclease
MKYARVPEELRNVPFTRAQATATGISDSALRSSPWRQVLRGVWAHVDVRDDRDLRLAAARLVLPSRAVVCGLSAAWIWGADVRRADELDVHVSFPRGGRVRPRPGLRVCQETLAPNDIWRLREVAITSPTRTAFDCLRLLRGAERVVVADALTHLGRTTVRELREYFAGQQRLRNLRVGEALLDDIEPLAESPTESRLRLAVVTAGLPRPVAQFEVYTPAGAFVARVDLAYPELRLAIEYDGAWHWKRRREDDRRRDALRALGWTVLVYSADDLYNSPERIVAEVARARRTAARRAAVPPNPLSVKKSAF